jgi:hypothetical protein
MPSTSATVKPTSIRPPHILIPPPKGKGHGNRGREWANGYTYQVYDVGEAVRVIDNRVYDWVHAVEEKEKELAMA